LTDEEAKKILERWKELAPMIMADRKNERKEFESGLLKRWEKPLELLDILLGVSAELGETFDRQFRDAAAVSNDHVFIVLKFIHGRLCKVAGEVRLLLRSGYADGAMARWRTAYELVAIAFFVKEHGQDVAERYLAHQGIEAWKTADDYLRSRGLDGDEFSEEDLQEAIKKRDRLCDIYGKEFAKLYGWAAEALERKDVSFRDVEKASGISHLRPYYKMASHHVHAGVQGDRFSLGHPEGESREFLVAGPSIYGLADPGQDLAISVYQICTCLLATRPTSEHLAVHDAMHLLLDEIKDAFIEVHRDLEKSWSVRKSERRKV
jgi:hypothetical protein